MRIRWPCVKLPMPLRRLPQPHCRPGVMWHTVRPNENLITIASEYNANAKTLSELNPEIDFVQCEYGELYGGPQCSVIFSVGQLVRVPAPTALPTLSPTPDPNATALPSATATVNQPNAFMPQPGQYFSASELVTLRWVPSATLGRNQSYRVDIVNQTTGETHQALTREISLVLPMEWQGTSKQRFTYIWTVGVVSNDNLDVVSYRTEPRSFIWQGIDVKAS